MSCIIFTELQSSRDTHVVTHMHHCLQVSFSCHWQTLRTQYLDSGGQLNLGFCSQAFDGRCDPWVELPNPVITPACVRVALFGSFCTAQALPVKWMLGVTYLSVWASAVVASQQSGCLIVVKGIWKAAGMNIWNLCTLAMNRVGSIGTKDAAGSVWM